MVLTRTGRSSTPAKAKRESKSNSTPEGCWTSTLVLVTCLIVSFAVTSVFDASPLALVWAVRFKRWLWAVPSYVAVSSVVLYFVMVMWHLYVRSEESKAAAKARADTPGSWVGQLLPLWNYFLMVWSFLMLTGLAGGVMRILAKHGMRSYLCDGELAWGYFAEESNAVSFWATNFALSKFPELLDTTLLVVRGRAIMFLHWYHHISVLLYVWLVFQTGYPGLSFALINAFVHSVMYYYYARTAQGIRPDFAKFITVIQLTQMVAGICISTTQALLWYIADASAPCDGGRLTRETKAVVPIMWSSAIMYGSYFFLFAQFFVKRYAVVARKTLENKNQKSK